MRGHGCKLISFARICAVAVAAAGCAWGLGLALAADSQPIFSSDQPFAITFPAQQAKFVRVNVSDAGGEACLDELEVYGEDLLQTKVNFALAKRGGVPTASSCILGYDIHAIENLNDGLYGNDHSWVAGSAGPEWVQVQLAQPQKVAKVVVSRDRMGQYADRVPRKLEVCLSMDGQAWTSVRKIEAKVIAVSRRDAPAAGSGVVGFVPDPPPPPRADVPAPATTAGPAVADLNVPRKDALGFANLALAPAAKAEASSVFGNGGNPIHQVRHLNDGQAGNEHSWISNQEPSWAQIELGEVCWVYKVAFGNDSSRRYADRAATHFAILTATQYSADSAAATWKVVARQQDTAIHDRAEFKFKPVPARWVRVAIEAAQSGPARIDELEVYGQKDAIDVAKIGPVQDVPAEGPALAAGQEKRQLQAAWLGEEHVWLKTWGRADLQPYLVPYNPRVVDYPRHAGEDRLPLCEVAAAPKLDGKLDDACWASASRGAARVAWPYEFETGALVTYELYAARQGENLLLAVRTNRLLSAHLAVLSSPTGGTGVIAIDKGAVVLNTYSGDGKLQKSTPLQAGFDKDLTCFEMVVPLAAIGPDAATGLRVGLGMGGRHTGRAGRPIMLAPSPLSLAEEGCWAAGNFRVRLSAAKAATLTVNVPGMEGPLTLAAGQPKVISIPARPGPIGPQFELKVRDEGGETWSLNLFRYDPLGRTLNLMNELAGRLGAKGLDVSAERKQLETFRRRHEQLMASSTPDLAAERQAFHEARLAKRQLFLREPELAAAERLLFVKRHAFEPSHNYSDYFDMAWRPGGGVCTLSIPRVQGRLEPAKATVTQLFNAGRGVARNPMANFNLTKIYFSYRTSSDGYFQIFSMNPDGSDVRPLTDGPFQNLWPCPLPDGGLAFISTRCKARYLCWRPQASILFRMDANGQNMRPLSLANLTEWAPSVMDDGRIIWTRSEYIDKGANFGHTLWAIRPDGSHTELVFGNDIIQPAGYANGHEVPGSTEVLATMISHFGDLNGPLALLDTARGRLNPDSIVNLTPEVPRPGGWPREEYYRESFPIAKDYFLVAHAPRYQAEIYVLDRFGNREMLYADPNISAMCPQPYRVRKAPPVLFDVVEAKQNVGELLLADVYEGLDAKVVKRGSIKYLRVVEEVRAGLLQMPNGEYQKDHEPFMTWYASPVDVCAGPFGWPTYVAKAPLGLAPVREDGSAHFAVPCGKTFYLQALDKDFNEVQRMRSVMQLQAGEKRSCIGCHEPREMAPPPLGRRVLAAAEPAMTLEKPSFGDGPLFYEKVVQPVLNARCVRCHDAKHKKGLNFTGVLDQHRVPASYRTLISRGLVHYADLGWESGGNSKLAPLTFGSVKSKLWQVLNAGHNDVHLTTDEMIRIKTWIDLNCPLWGDYKPRAIRSAVGELAAGN